MKIPTYQEMLDAGVHFGHLRKKWNPKMRQYIFAEHKGIHIIDVNRTSENLEKAANALKNIVKSGRKVMAGWYDDQFCYYPTICQKNAQYRTYAGCRQ